MKLDTLPKVFLTPFLGYIGGVRACSIFLEPKLSHKRWIQGLYLLFEVLKDFHVALLCESELGTELFGKNGLMISCSEMIWLNVGVSRQPQWASHFPRTPSNRGGSEPHRRSKLNSENWRFPPSSPALCQT